MSPRTVVAAVFGTAVADYRGCRRKQPATPGLRNGWQYVAL
jgi:hypothetical protein